MDKKKKSQPKGAAHSKAEAPHPAYHPQPSNPSGPKVIKSTGGNLFGYLSQTYMSSGKEAEQAPTSSALSSRYEDTAAMATIHGVNDNLKLAFKKLQKKDSSTKMKGILEAKAIIEGMTVEELENSIEYYVYVFSKIIATEYDRKIREAACQILQIFINKEKKLLKNPLQRLAPYWTFAFYDPAQDVAACAKAAYDNCFPKEKQVPSAWHIQNQKKTHFPKQLVANDYMKTSKESLLEDLGHISEAEKEDIYERVISCAIKTLIYCFEASKGDPETKAKAGDTIEKILQLDSDSSTINRYLSSKYKSGIRAAILELIVVLIENINPAVIKKHERLLSEFILYQVSESSLNVQNMLWSKTLIGFLNLCGHSCWNCINVKKAFLNKLYQCLRKAAFGAAPAMYSNFLIVLSLFPFIKLEEEATAGSKGAAVPSAEEEKKDLSPHKTPLAGSESTFTLAEQLQVIRDILSNMFKAIYAEEAIIYHENLVACFFDTMLFILWKRLLPAISKRQDESFYKAATETAFSLVLIPLELFKKKDAAIAQKSYDLVSAHFALLFKKMMERKLDERFVMFLRDSLLGELRGIFLGSGSKHTDLSEIHINLLYSFCSHLKSSPESTIFTEELVKLACNYISTLRKEIAAGFESHKDKPLNAIAVPVLHYCISTYKFICMEQQPIVMQIFEGEIAKQEVSENSWVMKAACLEEDGEGVNGMKHLLLSYSGLLIAFGDRLLLSFEKLFSLCAAPKCNPLIKQFLLNPIAVTMELEKEIILKEGKGSKRRIETKSKKSDLAGLMKIMNTSQKWKELYLESIKTVCGALEKDKKEREAELIKQLLDDYLNGTLNTLNDKLPAIQIEESVILTIIEAIHSESLKGTPYFLQDVLPSFLSLFLNPNIKLSPKLSEKVSLILMDLIAFIYRYIVNSNAKDTIYSLWDIVLKLFSLTCIVRPEARYGSVVSLNAVAPANPTEKQIPPLFQFNYYNHYQKVLQSMLHSQLEAKQKASLKPFITIIQEFLQILKKFNATPILFLEAVFFTSPQINQIFQSLNTLQLFTELFLRSGIGNFVPMMLIDKVGKDYKYLPIIAELFKSLFLPCTADTVQIRDQITLYVDLELLPAIFALPVFSEEVKAGKEELVKIIVGYLVEQSLKEGSMHPLALEHFLSQLILAIKEERAFTKTIKFIEDLFLIQIVGKAEAQKALPGNNNESLEKITYNLLSHILSSISAEISQEKDDPANPYSCTALRNNILKLLGSPSHELAKAIGLYSCTLTQKEITQQKELQQKIVAACLQNYHNYNLEESIHIFSYFLRLMKLSNIVLQQLGVQKDFLLCVIHGLTLCEKESKKAPQLLNDICEILSSMLSSSVQFDISYQALINRLIELAYMKCQENRLRGADSWFEVEYEMFVALGKLLTQLSSYNTGKRSEELLYGLLSVNIVSIQKGAYDMLKKLYMKTVPDLVHPVEEKWDPEAIMSEIAEDEKTGGIKAKIYEDLSRNIPLTLMELINQKPIIELASQAKEGGGEAKKAATSVEQILSSTGEDADLDEHPIISPQMYSYFLAWNCMLHKVQYGWLNCRKIRNKDYLSVINSLSSYLNDHQEKYEIFLIYLSAYLPTKEFPVGSFLDLTTTYEPSQVNLHSNKGINLLALYSLFNFMRTYPSLARNFFQKCDAMIGKALTDNALKVISPTIWISETTSLQNSTDILKEHKLEVSIMQSVREVIASLKKDDVSFSISLKFPLNYPLKSIEVTHLTTGIFTEHELKTWNIAMSKLISSQNCDLLGALLLWKENYDKKFEGVEPCPICYAIVHEETNNIPTLQCKTCKNKFHTVCMKKWFRTSHKNKCPFCQNYFF